MTFAAETSAPVRSISDDVRAALGRVCPVDEPTAIDGTDWWPLAKVWARNDRRPAAPVVTVRPRSAQEVAAVLAICSENSIPVTPAGARSGVCGGAIPIGGGVALDLLGLCGEPELDETSLLVRSPAGVYGATLESWLAERDYSTGHFPQSIDISTVGGWVACRSAGQWSTRYGKVEDMVRGLTVALASGDLIEIEAQPARATGPDLLRLFAGSEGTLGVITDATLVVHPTPETVDKLSFAVPSFDAGLDAIRRVLRRGARPPVIRLYDERETKRQYSEWFSEGCALLCLTEGEPGFTAWEAAVLREECGSSDPSTVKGNERGPDPIDAWMHHRNDVSGLDAVIDRGFVVDTCEVAAPWTAAAGVYRSGVEALRAVAGTVAATAHASHAYPDGVCLYFTLAGLPGEDLAQKDAWYLDAWNALMAACSRGGATIAHHHGIGLLRGPALRRELGPAFAVLQSVKDALDPAGVLNPGKLGFADRLGLGAPAFSLS